MTISLVIKQSVKEGVYISIASKDEYLVLFTTRDHAIKNTNLFSASRTHSKNFIFIDTVLYIIVYNIL
jgi:hypothetical protein